MTENPFYQPCSGCSGPPCDRAHVYEQAHFEVQLPGGTVTLTLAGIHAGDPSLLPPDSLTIVTAYNPGPLRPTDEQNQHAQRQLEAYIPRRGWTAYPACGHDPAQTHHEPSLAVLGLTRAQALRLGQHFQQAAVFYWHNHKGDLLWC